MAFDNQQAERRRWHRHELDTAVLVRSVANRSRCFWGRLVDLSQGGIAVVLPAELPVEEVFEICFPLPYPVVHVLAKAVVRRREHYRYGLEFADMTPSDRQLIALACKTLSLQTA